MKKTITPPAVILMVAVAVTTALAWYTFSSNNGKAGIIEASGTIEALEVMISAETGGKLKSVSAEEGIRVKKGQKLGEIESEALAAQLKQASAGVKIASLRLDIARAGTRTEQLRAAHAQLKQAIAQKKGTDKAVKNALALYNQRTPLKTQVDLAETQKSSLESQISGAEELLDNTEELTGLSPETEALEAELEATRLQREQAEELAEMAAEAEEQAFDYYQSLLALWPGTTEVAQMQLINTALMNYQAVAAEHRAADDALEQLELVIEGIETALENSEDAKDISDKTQLDSLENQLDVLDRQLLGAEKSLANAKTLYNDRTQAQQVVDGAKTQSEIAGAVEEAARAQLDLLESGALPEDVEILEAALEQARAVLEQATAAFNKTLLSSPITGLIGERYFEAGELVTPGAPVYTVLNLKQVNLTVYVEEVDLGKVKVGQEVDVKIDSFPNRTFSGKVSRISSQAEFTPSAVQTKEERSTTVYEVTVSIANPSETLKSGMPADAFIKTEQLTVNS